jgi:arylsulfatase A-like enzyme
MHETLPVSCLLLSILSLVFVGTTSAAEVVTNTRPNILIIVADDMGFSDLGSFGSEIDTPNLDELAYGGVRFTDFQVAPACSPTRAMLLTGVDNHLAGLGNLAEEISPNQKGQPGYEGHLNEKVVSVAKTLREGGYRTYLSGKWHMGYELKQGPKNHGFDRSFALLSGGASHFSDMQPAYATDPEAVAPYLDEGVMLTSLPVDFKYSSQYYVDRMIDYMEQDRDTGRPFFALLGFTAPHWPLQAPDEAIAKYEGKYTDGYDQLFAQRRQRMIELGLLAKDTPEPPRPPKAVPWDSLGEEARRVQTRAMAVYAAMIDQVDVHTGRLLDYLKRTGQFDNTVIIFMSDNGPEGHDLDETWPAYMFPKIRAVIDQRFDHSEANMGRPNSYTLYGAGWARASSPHLRMYKGFPSEGGVRVVAFAHAPGRVPAGTVLRESVSVMDIAPTLLDYAGLSQRREKGVYSMRGTSIRPALEGPDNWHGDDRALGIELLGKYGLRYGQWKFLHMQPPYGTGEPELYNLAQDPGESDNLAGSEPQVMQKMLGL